jgi:hypothetical protein
LQVAPAAFSALLVSEFKVQTIAEGLDFVKQPPLPAEIAGHPRAALFTLHLRKRGRDPSAFDVVKLAGAGEGFSGAEIEQSIVSGLYTSFSAKQQLSTEILLAELARPQPLSVTWAEEIRALREWARERAVPAN